MNTALLEDKFARMGARLQLGRGAAGGRWRRDVPLTLDIRSDGRGEFFDVRVQHGSAVELDILDLRKRERHLLLLARDGDDKSLYLCGHDERHWFVAAIPESARGVANVATAMEALKPAEVLEAQARQGVKGKDRRRRKNVAYRRQGEWFFLPAPHLKPDWKLVLHHEPLSRGNGGKPHWAEFCYRVGGETVHVCDQFPAGLRSAEYGRLLAARPKAKAWNWRRMQRDPEAYVRGRIRHEDHETINLLVWHKVVMNTEGQARAMRHVVFLD
jgi:hypothetical protein